MLKINIEKCWNQCWTKADNGGVRAEYWGLRKHQESKDQ